MIRTLDAALEGAALLDTETRAAMPAHVVVRANRAVPGAHDQHARAGDVAADERAGMIQLIHPARRQPHPRQDAIHFDREPIRVGVGARRQRRAQRPRSLASSHRAFHDTTGVPPPPAHTGVIY
jgi:hypothetical protein